MRFLKNSVKILLIISFFSPALVFGYAWEREKDKKYDEYGLTLDPG